MSMAANLLEVPLDDALFRVLSSESRREILRLLQKRRMTGTELAQSLDLGKPAVSEHLKKLHDAGLVLRHDDPERRWVYFSLSEHGRTLLEPRRTRFILVLSVAVAALLLGAVLGAALMGVAPSSTTGDLDPEGSAAGSGGLGAAGMDLPDAVDSLPEGNGTRYLFRAEDIDIPNRTILAEVYMVVHDTGDQAAFYSLPNATGPGGDAPASEAAADADPTVEGTPVDDAAAGANATDPRSQVIPGTIVHVTSMEPRTGRAGGATATGGTATGDAGNTSTTAPEVATTCPAPTPTATADGDPLAAEGPTTDPATNTSTAESPTANGTTDAVTDLLQDTDTSADAASTDGLTSGTLSGTSTATAAPTKEPGQTSTATSTTTATLSPGDDKNASLAAENATTAPCPETADAGPPDPGNAPAVVVDTNGTEGLLANGTKATANGTTATADRTTATTNATIDAGPSDSTGDPTTNTSAPGLPTAAGTPALSNGTDAEGGSPSMLDDAATRAENATADSNGTLPTGTAPAPGKASASETATDAPTDASSSTGAPLHGASPPTAGPGGRSPTTSSTPTPHAWTTSEDGVGTNVDRSETLHTAPGEDAPAVRQDGDAWLQPLLLTILGLVLLGAWIRNRRP